MTAPSGEPKPLGPHARAAIIGDLRDWIRDLTRHYRPEPNGPRWPALLPSLDHPRTLTTPLDDGGRATKPGSRPPYNVTTTSLAVEIRAQAVKWDRDLRRSTVPRTPEVALPAIPNLADTADDDDLRELGRTVHHWHTTACVILGYVDEQRDTPRHYPDARCMQCGRREIYGVVSRRSAVCGHCCEDYPHARLLLLIRQAERGDVA